MRRAKKASRSGSATTTCAPVCRSASRKGAEGGKRSVWVTAMTRGLERSAAKAMRSGSGTPCAVSAATPRTMSARASACAVRARRASPRMVASSHPPVSSQSTGPKGRSSMAFSTTSVVVPAMGETMATSCPAMRLRRVDFPTLALPARAMVRRLALGVAFIGVRCGVMTGGPPMLGVRHGPRG